MTYYYAYLHTYTGEGYTRAAGVHTVLFYYISYNVMSAHCVWRIILLQVIYRGKNLQYAIYIILFTPFISLKLFIPICITEKLFIKLSYYTI